IAIGACLAVCVPLVLAGRTGGAPRRAALLGIATGVLFALSAALTKAVVDQLDDGILTIFTTWHLYALVAIGYASMTLNQLALNTGALDIAATVLALAAAAVGMAVLSRQQSQAPAPV